MPVETTVRSDTSETMINAFNRGYTYANMYARERTHIHTDTDIYTQARTNTRHIFPELEKPSCVQC